MSEFFSLGLVDEAAFEARLDEMAVGAEEAARPAAQAGAQVFVDAVRANVNKIPKRTGTLAAAIYQAFSKDNSTPTRAVYHVSWNAAKAPHGHLIEFGHLQLYEIFFSKKHGRFYTRKDRPLATPKQVAAQPFVRPALALIGVAQEAMRSRYFEVLAKKSIAQ